MIDIKSISQDQRKYKNRTPNDLNIKLIAIMVNFLFQYRWWAFPFANTFSRNFTSDWKLSKWCSCFPLRTYSFSVDLKTYLTAHNLKNLPYTFQVFLFEVVIEGRVPGSIKQNWPIAFMGNAHWFLLNSIEKQRKEM